MENPLSNLGNLGRRGRPAQPFSIAESEWRGATVETCRIVDVNITDWSVNCVSEYGNKKYFDIQVNSPYFHLANGEGIYVQPEVGALCWVCVPSSGRFAAPFVLGFQSAADEDFDGFRGGRQTLNPGDIMLRTRDENFLVLRRGGVIQLGATPTAQRIYLPIRNFIKDFCENYELFTFGGELTWHTERDDQTTDGSALTKFSLRAKEKANNKGHVATLTIGSHGEDSPTTLLLEVFESGDEGAVAVVHLEATKEGDVKWQVKRAWELVVDEGDITLTATKGSFALRAGNTGTFEAEKDILVKSATAKATVEGMNEAALRSSLKAVLNAPVMHLGDGASSPVVKGEELVKFLTKLINHLATFVGSPPTAPIPQALATPAVLLPDLSRLLSTSSFTK